MLTTTLVLGSINDTKSSISQGYTDKRIVKFKGYQADGELTFKFSIEGKDKEINKILKKLNVIKLDDTFDIDFLKTSKKPVQQQLGDKKTEEEE